jgi:hydrogenase maturation protein HypF
LPVTLKEKGTTVLALGGHLKNTIALTKDEYVFLSQHNGDLETSLSFDAFKQSIKHIKDLYELSPNAIACDLHPDYFSTQFALPSEVPMLKVQHHHAHIVSCMAENHIDQTVLGVAWDGTGMGTDQTLWGGEFLICSLSDFKRVGYFKPFRLPGGEKAIKEPGRVALGLLYEIFRNEHKEIEDLPLWRFFNIKERNILYRMLGRNVNCPLTSSVGRLFDGVAALMGLKQVNSFEGQAAMALEYLLDGQYNEDCYPFQIIKQGDHSSNETYIVDWTHMIKEIIKDMRLNVSIRIISARFHNTLSEMLLEMVKKISLRKVVLSGGCFQNKYLTERTIQKLKKEGYQPYWHWSIPPNDGGIALGQAVVAQSRLKACAKGDTE